MAKTKTKSAAKKPASKKKVVEVKSVSKKTVNKKSVMSPKKKTASVKKSVTNNSTAIKKTPAVKKAVKLKTTVKKTNNKPAIKKETVTVKKVNLKPVKKTISKSKTTSIQNSSPEDSSEKKLRKFKPNKKARYTKSELKHFRDIILKERKAIFESAKANMEALVDKDSGEYKGDNQTYSSHMAEQGSDEMEREKNYLFVQRDEKYLGYLQDALTRIDQGTYGICVDCRDEPKNLCRSCPLVAKERLELVPITQHCIECKNLRG